MAELPEKIVDGIDRVVRDEGLELVHCDWLTARRKGRLELVIDREGGVGIVDCERISKLVSAWLDVEDPFPGSYDLEVSSPGLDRLFYRAEDYQRFLGRLVRTKLLRPCDGQGLIVGKLTYFDGKRLTVVDGKSGHEYNIGFPDVRWTRLEIDLPTGKKGSTAGRGIPRREPSSADSGGKNLRKPRRP